MLKIAQNAKFDAQTFNYWHDIPKDVRWMIIRKMNNIGKDVHTVSQEFFKAIYSTKKHTELVELLFDDSCDMWRNPGRMYRYLIYNLINVNQIKDDPSHYLLYLEFEWTIITKKTKEKCEHSGPYRHVLPLSNCTTKKNITYVVDNRVDKNYSIGLIKYISSKSKELGKIILLEYLKVCSTYYWILDTCYDPEELLDLVDSVDDRIGNSCCNYCFRMKKYKYEYEGKAFDNGDNNKMESFNWDERIFTIKEFYPYISNNKHNGHMFRQRLIIHYYYDVPIELMDFVSGTLYNGSYTFSRCTVMIKIFRKFVDAFMNGTEYPLIFDQPLSERAAAHIIISAMCRNSIFNEIIRTSSDVWNKLVQVSGLYLVEFDGSVEYYDPNDNDFLEQLSKYIGSDADKISIAIDDLTNRYHSDEDKLVDIIYFLAGNGNYDNKRSWFVRLLSKIINEGKIKNSNVPIDRVSLINKVIPKLVNEDESLIPFILSTIKKHKLESIIDCESLMIKSTKLEIEGRYNRLYYSPNYNTLPNDENLIDELLRLCLTKEETEDNIKKFKMLHKHYNKCEERVKRYHKILEEFK